MLNQITVMGRLTRDPELRQTQTEVSVATFTVAVERDFKDKESGEKTVDFIDVVAWRGTGEFVSKYFFKGSLVAVSGRLTIRDWEDKDGNKRRNAEIVADNVYFAEPKRADSGSAEKPREQNNPPKTSQSPDLGGDDEEDTLPF